MCKFDDADWHYGGDFPDELPNEAGATHIGMFMAWVILSGHEGELLREYDSRDLQAVRDRKMTGRDFVMKCCDEKLIDEHVDEEACAFAKAYYSMDAGMQYLVDYERVFDDDLPSPYHVADTWENADRIIPVIANRFEKWRLTRS